MSFNFPSPATVGQLYPDPAVGGSPQYRWNGVAWDSLTLPGAGEFVKKVGDTMSGFLTLHADPDEAMKAATKQFVDNAIAAIPAPDLSSRVSKAGDTMSGFLSLHADPTSAMHAATYQYVERRADEWGAAHASNRVSKAGDTMTGSLTLNPGEIYLRRSGSLGEGLMYFGNANAAYLHWTGGNFYFSHWVNMAGGAQVPTAGGGGSNWVANCYQVEDRAYAWADNRAAAHFANAMPLSGGSFSGYVTIPSVNTTIPYGARAGYLEIDSAGGGSEAMITFHRVGAFACNFGLATDNNFYYGGWSFGGSSIILYSSNNHAGLMKNIVQAVETVEIPETKSSLRAARSDLRELLMLVVDHFEKREAEDRKKWRRPDGRPYES